MTLKKVTKLLSNLITLILFITLIFMIFVVISSKASGGEPEIFGYQLKTVLSGSMEPGIKTGSIIAVKPGGDMTRFKENDVITFLREDKVLVTHRIIEVNKSGEHTIYTTKGDNNESADMSPVLSDNVVAEYTGFTIPYIGYFLEFAKSKMGSLVLLVLPGILLLAYSVFTIWQVITSIDKRANTSTVQEETVDVKQ